MQQHAVERNQLEQRIVQLSVEHRDLDDVIKRLGDQRNYDQVQLQRLKRRKLLLKDQISWLERQLDPDVPAQPAPPRKAIRPADCARGGRGRCVQSSFSADSLPAASSRLNDPYASAMPSASGTRP